MAQSEEDRWQAAYSAIASRRASYDSLMWQVPALGLSAQAFLLTIALGPDTARVPRLASAGLASLVALLSMQLMAKHRFHEALDSITLEMVEVEKGIRVLGQVTPHDRPDRRLAAVTAALEKQGKSAPRAFDRPWYVRQASYRAWMFGLAIFATSGILVAVATLLDLDVFR